MKCKCGLEMELWQSSLYEGNLVKRWRCVCGNEQSEFIDQKKPELPPIKYTKKGE
jgi:hypothetical protein